jgi:L-lactate permease
MDTDAFKGRSLYELLILPLIKWWYSPKIKSTSSKSSKSSKSSNPYYTFYLPNIDIIVSILPFLLLTLFIFTAFFATYLLYGEVLFYPSPT